MIRLRTGDILLPSPALIKSRPGSQWCSGETPAMISSLIGRDLAGLLLSTHITYLLSNLRQGKHKQHSKIPDSLHLDKPIYPPDKVLCSAGLGGSLALLWVMTAITTGRG